MWTVCVPVNTCLCRTHNYLKKILKNQNTDNARILLNLIPRTKCANQFSKTVAFDKQQMVRVFNIKIVLRSSWTFER